MGFFFNFYFVFRYKIRWGDTRKIQISDWVIMWLRFEN